MKSKKEWLALLLMFAGLGGQESLLLAQVQAPTVVRQVKRRVMPDYPDVAKRMNLTGKVRLRLVIAADGHVKESWPLGGHPVLVKSAEDAVRSWKFAAANDETTQVVELEFAGTEVH